MGKLREALLREVVEPNVRTAGVAWRCIWQRIMGIMVGRDSGNAANLSSER